MDKNLLFVIKANQDFIRHTADDAKINASVLNTLFENITDIYLPLLNLLNNGTFKQSNKISMVLTPVLCTLLSDSEVQELYLQWLDKRIELGKNELNRNKDNSKISDIIKDTINKNEKAKEDFENVYAKNLIAAFAKCIKDNRLELLATCATDLFIPHYTDTPEIISAQIECGLHSFREYFGEIPEGFWIPELGYFPGVENLIKAYGFSYTILEARAMLLAKKIPEKGIFYPVRTDNSLVFFANDPEAYQMIFGENGYASDVAFVNQNSDIGFDLPMENLGSFIEGDSVRYSTGYKYFNKASDSSAGNYYDKQTAQTLISSYAKKFVNYVDTKLTAAAKCVPESDFVNLVLSFDTDTIRSTWTEAVDWLSCVIEEIANTDVQLCGGNQLLINQYSLEKFEPYYSASGSGYGEEFLSSKTSWMMRYIKKASERIIDLADRFPNDTGLKTRLLNLGARELLMAQSTGLIKMIVNCENSEFAERRFKDSIAAFTAVFDSLGSNTVSTEWLTTLEIRDSIFPWINYKVFAKKI